MYCLTVSYPNVEGKSFDMAYYQEKHLPLVKAKFTEFGLQGVYARENTGAKPGAGGQYIVSVDIVFNSIDDMKAALANAGAEINADIKNYTDAQAEISFSNFNQVV